MTDPVAQLHRRVCGGGDGDVLLLRLEFDPGVAVAGRRPPGCFAQAVEGGGQRLRRVGAAERAGVGGRRRRAGEAVHCHSSARARRRVVLHTVAHRAVLPLGGEIAGLAVDGAVVAHRKRRGVRNNIGGGACALAGQARREVAELAPQQRQHLAAAVHRNRLAVRLHHVRVRVQQEDVHLAEARIRLAQIRRRRLAFKVAAHHHRAHTNGTQRLPIDELRLPLQPPNRLRIHQGHRVAERETRLGQRLDRLVTRPPPRLPRK